MVVVLCALCARRARKTRHLRLSYSVKIGWLDHPAKFNQFACGLDRSAGLLGEELGQSRSGRCYRNKSASFVSRKIGTYDCRANGYTGGSFGGLYVAPLFCWLRWASRDYFELLSIARHLTETNHSTHALQSNSSDRS